MIFALGGYLDWDQFGHAAGVLERFHGVLRGEFRHDQRPLAVGCSLDTRVVNSLNILRTRTAGPIDFHEKFRVLHH